jgi:ribonuclease T1
MQAGALSFWAVFYTITALRRAALLTDQGWKHSNMVPRTVNRESSSSACGLTTVAPTTVARTTRLMPAKQFRIKTWSAAFLTGVVLSCVALWVPGEAKARRYAPQETQAAETSVPLSSLPEQAQDVHRRILAGGPFRFTKDGVVFGNRERFLPRQPRGFYREYTVPTPGERDRGARRIVCGGKKIRQPETCFYTKDHYQSFQAIDPLH